MSHVSDVGKLAVGLPSVAVSIVAAVVRPDGTLGRVKNQMFTAVGAYSATQTPPLEDAKEE